MYSRILRACQDGEFVKANDAYILTAIGNAAWPIGITSVGMHARSAHDKMQTGQVGESVSATAAIPRCILPPISFYAFMLDSTNPGFVLLPVLCFCEAHVMNNEMQRKYLQSVKRLIKFEQNRRDDVLPSKKVM